MFFLENEIRLIFIVSLFLLLVFVGFVVFVIVTYNKNQQLQYTKNELLESQHQKEIIEKELERNYAIQLERERISHDMHDELGAGISALKLNVEFVKNQLQSHGNSTQELDEILEITQDMNSSMREMLWSLNTQKDDLQSFKTYVFDYAQKFFKNTAIKLIREEKNITSQTKLNATQRRHLFLCIKEALNNIYKHSQATEIQLSITQMPEEVRIKIEDNGKGFSLENAKGNGLKNMKKRIQDLNGAFQVQSDVSGTVLFFRIPLEEND